MGYFKVLTTSLGGHKNKVFKSGRIVTEKDFPPGNVPALVAKRFLQACDENGKPVEYKPDVKKEETQDKGEIKVDLRPTEKPEKKEPVTPKVEFKKESKPELSADDFEIEDLIKALQDAKVKFDPKAQKEELFKKWLTLSE